MESPSILSYLKPFAVRRCMGRDAEAVADDLHEPECCGGLALHHEDVLEMLAHLIHEREELTLIGMGRVAVNDADLGADQNGFAVYPYLFCAVNKPSAKRAGRLISGDEEDALRVREIALLMMKNAAPGGHAGAGGNDLGGGNIVDGL